MTIYYTAKDIEELAAQGVQQLQVGPGVTLTDFARETARQLNITLVDSRKQASSPTSPAPSNTLSRSSNSRDKYNKPSGCQHGMGSQPTPDSREGVKTNRPISGIGLTESVDSNTVSKLIDLMGEAIKRGE
jgi:hypothetical protein